MNIENENLNRFEDSEDMFDFICENLEENIFLYSVFMKFFLNGLRREAVKSFFIEIATTQFDYIFDRVYPYVKTRGRENLLYGLMLDDHKENGSRIP